MMASGANSKRVSRRTMTKQKLPQRALPQYCQPDFDTGREVSYSSTQNPISISQYNKTLVFSLQFICIPVSRINYVVLSRSLVNNTA